MLRNPLQQTAAEGPAPAVVRSQPRLDLIVVGYAITRNTIYTRDETPWCVHQDAEISVEDGLVALVNHDWSQQVASVADGNLNAMQDHIGLIVFAKLAEDEAGNRLRAAFLAGRVRGMSVDRQFAYRTERDAVYGPTCVMTQVAVREVSFCVDVNPANDSTPCGLVSQVLELGWGRSFNERTAMGRAERALKDLVWSCYGS